MDDARQISAFLAAAEELHLGRAADRLGVHPATVASRLRALESTVGLVLVDRSHRCRIALTQAGAALLPAARAAVEAMAAFVEQGAEVRDGTRGVVRVALTTDGNDRTEALVDELRRVDPGWEVSVERMDARAAGRALATGAVECAIGLGRRSPRIAPAVFDPRPHRREPTRVARIPQLSPAAGEAASTEDAGRTGHADAAGQPGAAESPRDPVEGTLVVAWRTRWELDDLPIPTPPRPDPAPTDPPSSDADVAPSTPPLASPSASHAATLIARVRQLRLLAGGRRAAAALAGRRAVAERRLAAEAERHLVAEETARYGPREAAARAAARERAEVLRRVADARSRHEPLGLHLTIRWLCLRDREDPDVGPSEG